MFWLGLLGIIVFFLVGSALIKELRTLNGILSEMLGSQAKAMWRVHDELQASNKR